MNFKETVFMSGGANSFLSSLRKHLKGQGIHFTNQIDDKFDLIFLNALTNGLNLKQLRQLRQTGKPIIHRKVGYRVSGTDKMRSVTDGIVYGDGLQIAFSPYIDHTIFQSEYSRDVFLSQGFYGDFSVIHNGVDKSIFNDRVNQTGVFGDKSHNQTTLWDETQPLVLGALTWSKDLNKGFEDYLKFDEALTNCSNVEIRFLGRKPHNIKFKNINVYRPRYKKGVAKFLKRCNGFIQMARFETCSNALIEAISCGLPIIYVDSGSSRELVEGCGVEFNGNAESSIKNFIRHYNSLATNARGKDFSIESVGQKYTHLFNQLLR